MYILNEIYGKILSEIASITEELIDSIALDKQYREWFVENNYSKETIERYNWMNEVQDDDPFNDQLNPEILPDNFFNE